VIAPTNAELASAMRVVARAIAAEMLSAGRETDAEWVDLRTLALGRKRGPELCRRWLSAGKSGVLQVGREWRVHRSVLDEFLGGVGTRRPKADTAIDRIERRLALVGGAR
jgi:hypothetical protein